MAGYYSEKSDWLKWVLVYLVIGGIVYFLVYKFYLGGKNPYSSPNPSASSSATPSNGTSPSPSGIKVPTSIPSSTPSYTPY
jgi:hypothetical protein